jgi:hypothetical protein
MSIVTLETTARSAYPKDADRIETMACELMACELMACELMVREPSSGEFEVAVTNSPDRPEAL